MNKIKAAFAIVALFIASHSNAALLEFKFEFYDANGIQFGIGQLSFDSVPVNTLVSFDSLTSLDWEFDLYGLISPLVLGSAYGHIAGLDAGSYEGIIFNPGSVSSPLSFYDIGGTSVAFGNLNNLPSIRLASNSNEIVWVRESWASNLATGTYRITMAEESSVGVASPSSGLIMSLGLGLVLMSRLRKAK